MPDMLSLIKQAAVEAVTEDSPMAFLFGIVIEEEVEKEEDELEEGDDEEEEEEEPEMEMFVKIEARFKLKMEQLIIPPSIGELAKDEVLALLRIQGGEKYYVMERF
jgi:hypothetical protein